MQSNRTPVLEPEQAEAGGNGHGKPNSAEVFRLLAESVNEYLTTPLNEAKVEEIVDKKLAAATLPQPLEIHLADHEAKVLEGRQHAQFKELLGLVNEGHVNLLMVGPAGSGKTTLGKNLAEALSLDYGFLSLSAGVTETHLFGRVLPQADGSWQFCPSRFVEIYEKGGVFLLDEMDAADANVMVAINAALANGVMANPHGKVHVRHPKCIILAAANTWGRGGDHQYVGRNQLDAATMDRFVLSTVHVVYDIVLEHDLAHASLPAKDADELLEWVSQLRDSITNKKIRRIASTRLVVNAIAALKAGKHLSDVKDRYFLDWSVDEKAKVTNE